MKQWRLDYQLQTTFDVPVARHAYTLRCFPKDMTVQQVSDLNIRISPCPGFCRGRDAFGNLLVTGYITQPHEQFSVDVDAVVMTADVPLEPEQNAMYKLGMYRNPTPLTAAGQNLEQFYRSLPKRSAADDWQRASQIMQQIYDSFSYVSGTTAFDTTAEHAWSQGHGVCQDYTHIFLALCRKEGMTVRYVAGAMPGVGQTHAWAQVLYNGLWKGYDPTNNRITNSDYICFAYGRDAADCFLNRGIFRGSAMQQQHIRCAMTCMDGGDLR